LLHLNAALLLEMRLSDEHSVQSHEPTRRILNVASPLDSLNSNSMNTVGEWQSVNDYFYTASALFVNWQSVKFHFFTKSATQQLHRSLCMLPLLLMLGLMLKCCTLDIVRFELPKTTHVIKCDRRKSDLKQHDRLSLNSGTDNTHSSSVVQRRQQR
jgi:hypothetical protein